MRVPSLMSSPERGPRAPGFRPANWIAGSVLVCASLASLSCGGGSPTTPTPSPGPPLPTVTSVAPASGSTFGGTEVTITGTNFASGATVTLGGAAAANVRVDSATSIRVATPVHGAGAVDVVVTVGTRSATLPAGFTFVAPPPNTPPTITGITVQGTRANEPPNFADLGEEVVVTATVTDPETPVTQLTFEWTATAGTFTGTGPSVRWRAPAQAATPLAVTLTLKVSETIAAATGADVASATQSVTGTAAVSLHDSAKEIADLAYQFLIDFSQQRLSPSEVVRNFWDGCSGKADELDDVTRNQRDYQITSFRVGATFPVTVNFKGTCPFRSKPGDACAQVPVEWHSVYKPTGTTETATGTDQTAMVFRNSRWWLCDSAFDGQVSNPLLPAFIR